MSNVCLGYGSPFPLVAVEKLRTGQAAACEHQFPCQIMGVLNACVEPKAARGRQAMSRITGQEDPPAAIGRGEHRELCRCARIPRWFRSPATRGSGEAYCREWIAGCRASAISELGVSAQSPRTHF